MADLQSWFTTTIPGIILLGAAGSILALIVISFLRVGFRILVRLLRNNLPRLYVQLHNWFFLRLMKLAFFEGYAISRLTSNGEDYFGSICYFSQRLAWLIFHLVLFAVTLLSGFLLLFIQTNESSRWVAGLLISAAFVFFVYAFRWAWTIKIAAWGVDARDKSRGCDNYEAKEGSNVCDSRKMP